MCKRSSHVKNVFIKRKLELCIPYAQNISYTKQDEEEL